MKLEVLASGSKGNCYLLHTSFGIIILEAGVPWKDVLKVLHFDITNVLCCLVTHEHMDHAKYINEYIKNGVSEVVMTQGTKNVLGLVSNNITTRESTWVNNVSIDMFRTQHDAEEPCGFYIEDLDTGEKLVFATDTYYVKYRFPNVNYILVECNYAEDILQKNIDMGVINPSRTRRLRESHFELSHVKEFIKANDSLILTNIVLLHLSSHNGDSERFKREISRVTIADVKVAEKGLKISLGGIY